MECETGDIVEMAFIDKRNTKLKSPLMEMAGFQKGLESLLQKSLNVEAVVTDGHMQIGALMSKFGCLKYNHFLKVHSNFTRSSEKL